MIERDPYRRRRGWSEGNGPIFALIAAMVVVMGVLAFTLNRYVLLGPSSTASAPATTGQGGALGEAPRSGAR
jgi:hypothetical protein